MCVGVSATEGGKQMPSRAKRNQYLVRFWVDDRCFDADWRWPDIRAAAWQLSEKDGIQWFPSGALTTEGRAAMLKHFELEARAAEFPMETLVSICPRDLEREFRKSSLARQTNEPHRSDRVGAHTPASLVV